jgi:hypothetical protein
MFMNMYLLVGLATFVGCLLGWMLALVAMH